LRRSIYSGAVCAWLHTLRSNKAAALRRRAARGIMRPQRHYRRLPEPMSGLTLEQPENRAPSPRTPVHTAVVACRLRCWCGAIEGTLTNPASANPVVCYCEYCQGYAHLLGRPQRVLDERGGSQLLQTRQSNVSFTSSLETLVCLRLTARGMLRWYARCCGTPIGNTPANPQLSFISMAPACLDTGGVPLAELFGPVTAWCSTCDAKGRPKPKAAGRTRMMRWLFDTTLNARLNGDYKRTPFFHPDTGAPVVKLRIVRPTELVGVMAAVRQSATLIAEPAQGH